MRRTSTTAMALSLALLTALAAGTLAACAGQATPSGSGGVVAGGPGVVIQSPPSNVQVAAGQALEIVTTAVAADGVGWIDLQVDGAVVSRATDPARSTSFSVVHVWTPTAPGTVSVGAVAYGASGTAGALFGITVFVQPAGSIVPPIPTFGGPRPTYVVTAVATGALPPASQAVGSYPPATGYATAPGYSTSPTYAAPTPTYAAATPTDVVATPTYAATSPTYTVAPTAPIAPPDATYSWVIPYNGANELSDFVSYPGGDVEDRVNYDVSGMSASPPGNTGHLNVFATCEGTGTENVVFKVGQTTFPCNTQIIVSQFITDESRTGSIRVVATGPAYVHWTLNGNVAP